MIHMHLGNDFRWYTYLLKAQTELQFRGVILLPKKICLN